MRRETDPFAQEGLIRRVAPFALVAGVVTLAAAFSFTPGHGAELVAAGALSGLLVAGALLTPWERLPRWTQATVPLGYFVVVALLRDATGGGRTPYTSLVFLPILWLALYGHRGEVWLALVAQAATLTLPVFLFGAPHYPHAELQRAGLSVSIAAFIGLVVHGLVSRLRESADEVSRQADSVKQAEARARESRDLLAGVLEAATEYSIIGTDPNGLITVFNEGASRMLGYSAEEMVGLHTPELIHDPDEVVQRANELGIPVGFEVFVAAARRGRSVTSDWTYVRKNGERLRVALTITAIRGAGEVPSGFIGIATDVTDQRRAEAEVRDRAERGSLINEMIGEVRQDLDPTSIMRRAVTALGEATSADRCLIRLVSGGDIGDVTEQWVREGIAPLDPEIALPEPLARLGEQSIREDSSLSIRDAMNDARLTADEANDIVDKLGARAYLGAPMWMGTRLVGWLVLHVIGEERNWTARDTAITEALARNVGPAILQAQSYLQEQEMVRKLRELDQAKTDFVSSVSHELRTPLTSITGYLEMLVDGDAGPLSRDQLDLLEVVDRNSQRLLMLIEDLLTLSRIESGRLGMAREPVDTVTLISGVEKAVLPLLSGRSLDFDVDVPADLGPVVGDFSQLERVLLNLLTNAIKFTPDGGSISLVGRAFDGAISLSVADTGIGIPEDEQDRLFTRFFRSSSAQQRAIQGTGLGLAIVKSIVEQHGGSIKVESTPDVGTTLTVKLPTQLEVGEEDGTT
ncbi:MAG: PAS domain-containing sensor histidine kinase [Actinomycetota bacterium]